MKVIPETRRDTKFDIYVLWKESLNSDVQQI